ncbi:MAG: nucleotide exchange factor GrpE [Albidovulum sp.]|nr:nucleotide exchange factor GrpE [Albidovulum sp.]MDE0307767.1 nucleotide exchange factor GrpE [Albidovulum sp.]MDE0532058.1 nucleotide exchange factor GrpE [Albidovulum sp.]
MREGAEKGADKSAESDSEADKEIVDEEPVSELDLLKSERDELKDRFLRALAESENIRKIAEREKREASKFGTTRFARDMLTVHDNLLRALETVGEEQRKSSKALIEGIELTLRELLNAFSRHGIAAIEPKEGDEFDPNLHQAMFYAPVKDSRNGTIVNVLAKGFTIHERLLRAAQVGVSSFVQTDEAGEQDKKDSSAAN